MVSRNGTEKLLTVMTGYAGVLASGLIWTSSLTGAATPETPTLRKETSPVAAVGTSDRFRDRLSQYVIFLKQAGQGWATSPAGEDSGVADELCNLQAGEVRAVLSQLDGTQNFESGWMIKVGLPLLGLAERDPEAALSVAGEMSPKFGPEAVECWQGEVLRITACREPAKAFKLLNAVRPEAFLAVGRGLGRAVRTPQQAAGMMEEWRRYAAAAPDSQSAGLLRTGILTGLMRGLQRLPFQEWLTWVETQQLDAHDQAALAESVSAYDDAPEELPAEEEMVRWLDWVKERMPPEKYAKKAAALVGGWARWFPDGAERWIASCKEDLVKEAAVLGFVEHVGGDSPDRALRVAMLLPEGGSRTAALKGLERAQTLKYGFYEEE